MLMVAHDQLEATVRLDALDPAGVRFEDLPEQIWPRLEIIDGSLLVTPLANVLHQFVSTSLATALVDVVRPECVALAGVNVLRRLQTDRLLIPDVAVVRASAIGPSLAVVPEDLVLAVEVISPSSRVTDLHLKRQLYAEWGVPGYWVVDVEARRLDEVSRSVVTADWLADIDLEAIWPPDPAG